jgi:uncharacterized protein
MVEKSFLGKGWQFPPTFHIGTHTGTAMVAEEADITESLQILLATHPNERVMLPEFGCGIHLFAFETIDATQKQKLKDAVERAILFFEHRIKLENIEIEADKDNNGKIWLNLDYTIRQTNMRANMVFPFYLQEK